MVTGRELRLPSDVLLPQRVTDPLLTSEHVIQLRNSLRRGHQQAQQHLQQSQQHQKDYFDKNAHGTPFDIGDLVWLRGTVPPATVPDKLHHEWKGPFAVTEILSPVTYRIMLPG